MDIIKITDKVKYYLNEIFKTKTEGKFSIIEIALKGRKNSRTLQIFLDKTGGITISDCVFITKQLSKYIDEDEAFNEHFVLEVSSPGEKRNIKEEKSDQL